MPSVLPRTSQLCAADLIHSPRWAAARFREDAAHSMMISPITSSATLRVLEKGALKTGIAWRSAASRSTWSVPMQKQPTAISRSAGTERLRRDLGARADAEEVHAFEPLRQLGFAQGRGQAGDAGVAGAQKSATALSCTPSSSSTRTLSLASDSLVIGAIPSTYRVAPHAAGGGFLVGVR